MRQIIKKKSYNQIKTLKSIDIQIFEFIIHIMLKFNQLYNYKKNEKEYEEKKFS